jgi:hypothetical protein
MDVQPQDSPEEETASNQSDLREAQREVETLQAVGEGTGHRIHHLPGDWMQREVVGDPSLQRKNWNTPN